MRRLNRWLRVLIYTVAVFVGLLLVMGGYLACVALVAPPEPSDLSVMGIERRQLGTNAYTIGNNWIRKSSSGLWEMYIEGAPFERGVVNGKLSKELIREQEAAFSEQISRIVPSSFYRGFLKYFIAWFNRDLEKNLTEEQKLEIYGVSRSASSEFDYIGSAYQRMMNYHAAHDIGHALQNMALVGCSSFATWNGRSEDSLLIIGRNFDFYAGDRFAVDKIVEFCRPESGHPFMMITWGGMTGVLSGMNMKGLTVTINAAKSEIPKGSATPISLLSREILQYAGNIQEALAIAAKRRTFVSESIMIGSSADNRAVIIEKSTDGIDMFAPPGNELICTNHYQSPTLSVQQINKEQMDESASVYRYNRMQQLLAGIQRNTPEQTASLLRNQLGLDNAFIGYGNEKAVNQLIAHHSVIFEPQKRLVWVSTTPWQLGSFVAYNLNAIFAMKGLHADHELNDSTLTIAPDTFASTPAFNDFLRYRAMRTRIMSGQSVDPEELVRTNPEYYHVYVLAGDQQFKKRDFAGARKYYEQALTKVIATKPEEAHIRERIKKCKEKEGG